MAADVLSPREKSPVFRMLLALAALVCVGLLSLAASACTAQLPVKALAPSYVSPYSWENLVFEDGRYYYYGEGQLQSRFGIDVSEHQKLIDWQAVADDGIEFAIIRIGHRGATEGALYTDEYYEANIAGAEQAGILTGVYFFSQAVNEEEALEEARFVLECLNGRDLDYPVAFDHEPVSGIDGRANGLTGVQISSCAEAFCRAIEEAGYDTMIYGNTADLVKLDGWLLNRYPVWFAEYDASYPTIKHDIFLWQYSSTGSVMGISTDIDLNIHILS